MPKYILKAKDAQGQIKEETVNLPNKEALDTHLLQRGLSLLEVKEEASASPKLKMSFLTKLRRISTSQKLFFTQHLQVMIKSGMPLGKTLDTLARQTSNVKFSLIIQDISKTVQSGVPLSEAFRKYPKVFPELYVNMIAAGEASGKLDEVLGRLTTQMKRDHQLISKIKGSLTYPIVILVAMIGIGSLLMVFVMPKIISLLEDAEVELPISTKILIAVTHFLTTNGHWAAIGLVLVMLGMTRIIRTKKGRSVYHTIMLKLPIVSPIIQKTNLARFTRSLSSLLGTDIPIVQTFKIISHILSNVHYQNAMKEAAEQIKLGVSIKKVLEKRPDLFPPLVTQMIAVGEESGTLDEISNDIAQFYEQEVDQTMSNLSSIIEPVLMLLMGGAIAFVAISVITPMYSLTQTI